jgi:hypothetical protein
MQESPQAFPVVQTLQHICLLGILAGSNGRTVGIVTAVGGRVETITGRLAAAVRVAWTMAVRVKPTAHVCVALGVRGGVLVRVVVGVRVAPAS